jgi:lysozyme
MRHITQAGLDLIKSFEGFSPTVYLCSAGVPTIGYGHAIKHGESFTSITEEDAENILAKDVEIAEKGVLRLINVPLSDGQFNALASFSFNLGTGALQRSSLRLKLNRGEYVDASDEFMKWVRAGGKVVKGLVRRREAERRMFLS